MLNWDAATCFTEELWQSMQNETNSMEKLFFVNQVAKLCNHKLQVELFYKE